MDQIKGGNEAATTVTHQIGEHNGLIGDSSLTQVCADAETAQPTKPACQPWCRDHDRDGDICASDSLDAGDGYGGFVSLAYQADEGHQIHMDRADGVTPEHGRQFAHAILALASKAAPPKTSEPLPDAWAKKAESDADTARWHVRYEYDALMTALAKDHASDQPAYWLRSHPCPTWCVAVHRSADHPVDRAHDSHLNAVDLDSMEPSTCHAEFLAPQVTLMLTQNFRDAEALIYVSDSSDTTNWYVSLDEAEALARHLMTMVRDARGQHKQLCLDEPCPNSECMLCNPAATTASSA